MPVTVIALFGCWTAKRFWRTFWYKLQLNHMKPIAFLPSAVVGVFAALTQRKTASITKVVRDDDKTLTLRIHYVSDRREVNYENCFNVEGWTKTQKEALVRRISDSLG